MLKVIHVLAVGLWFGAGMFFTFVVGLSLFDTFEKVTANGAAERPYWLRVPSVMEKAPPTPKFPDPLRKEQGSRIAGAAVGPMFFPYYLLQVVCGALGVVTALAWWGRGGVHRWRALVLVLALAGAGAGWWLDVQVEGLRKVRSDASDVVIESPDPTPEQKAAADEARAKFGLWHTNSLFANFGTLALVTAAMAMAAALPPRDPAHAA
jgi:acyl phosphate:glycerol-3-phosphate acyltransferase